MNKKIWTIFFVIALLCSASFLPFNKWVKLDDFKTNLVESAEWSVQYYDIDGKILTMMSTPVPTPHSKKLKLSGTIMIRENQKNVQKDIPDLPLTIDLYGGPEFDSPGNDINITYTQAKAGTTFESTFKITGKPTNLFLRIFHYFPGYQVTGQFKLNSKLNLSQHILLLSNKIKTNFYYVLTFLIIGFLLLLATHIVFKRNIKKGSTKKLKLYETNTNISKTIFNPYRLLLSPLLIIESVISERLRKRVKRLYIFKPIFSL